MPAIVSLTCDYADEVATVDQLNVRVSGPVDAQPILFVHGFGCDQHMWRFVAPAFESDHRVVTFDLVGAGGSDPAAWDPTRYVSLDAYADDILGVVHELDLHDVVLVGHSVSAMTGLLATVSEPDRFAGLVLVGPSPRYIDDGDYHGGFSEADITELLASLDSNYLGWSAAMAPVIMANPERPALGEELTDQLLPDGPGGRTPVRPGHLPQRLPRRASPRDGPHGGPAVPP